MLYSSWALAAVGADAANIIPMFIRQYSNCQAFACLLQKLIVAYQQRLQSYAGPSWFGLTVHACIIALGHVWVVATLGVGVVSETHRTTCNC